MFFVQTQRSIQSGAHSKEIGEGKQPEKPTEHGVLGIKKASIDISQ